MSEKRAETADLSRLQIDRDKNVIQNGNNSRTRNLALLGLSGVILLAIIYFLTSILSSTPTVKVTTVSMIYPSQADAILTASGYVVAQTQAAIASKGTGRLEHLSVEEGDEIKKGEIIAQLEHGDVDAAFEQARANLEMAKATLKQREADFHEARLNYERQKDLLEKGLISNSEYDIAEARFKSAEAAVTVANAQIELSRAAMVAAKVDVENTRIRAPFDGTVLTKNADIGEMVAPFAASSNSRGAVVTIADMSSLEVEADVSESNIQRVKLGQSCEISLDAFPDIRYPGYVHRIVPTADRAKATVLTKIRFKDLDEKVLPEMSAKVNFLSKSLQGNDESLQPFMAVSKKSVVNKYNRDVVFVVRDGIVTETPVSLGRKFGEQIEILSGVSNGAQVVLSPSDDLKSGEKIKIEE